MSKTFAKTAKALETMLLAVPPTVTRFLVDLGEFREAFKLTSQSKKALAASINDALSLSTIVDLFDYWFVAEVQHPVYLFCRNEPGSWMRFDKHKIGEGFNCVHYNAYERTVLAGKPGAKLLKDPLPADTSKIKASYPNEATTAKVAKTLKVKGPTPKAVIKAREKHPEQFDALPPANVTSTAEKAKKGKKNKAVTPIARFASDATGSTK